MYASVLIMPVSIQVNYSTSFFQVLGHSLLIDFDVTFYMDWIDCEM